MNIENISANFKLGRKPRSAKEAYNLLVAAAKHELEQKELILQELQETDFKQQFIDNWTPNTKMITVNVLDD